MTESSRAVSGRIFMSYRRDETAYAADWLYDRLTEHFGGEQVFKDVDSIHAGDDFVPAIAAAVESCDVLLVLISKEWLTISDADGERRIDNPHDFVRVEIEAALARNMQVIPVLVDGAKMPSASELPPSLRGLVRRQALEVSTNRLELDFDRLRKVLDTSLSGIAAGGDISLGASRDAAGRDVSRIKRNWQYQQQQNMQRQVQYELPRGRLTFGRGRGQTKRWHSLDMQPDDAVARAVRAAVKPGLLIFNPPPEMIQGRWERVEVGIARSPEFHNALAAGLRGRGEPQFEQISTSPFMSVELSGPSFEVVSFGPTEQLVPEIARWEFDVMPYRAGHQTLTLCVSLRVDSPMTTGGRMAVPVLKREIRIRVDVGFSARRFLANNWQWLIATAVGLGGALAAWATLFH